MSAFLETERLVLRRLTEADTQHLVELDSDPAVMRFLTGSTPTPPEVIRDAILPRFLRSYAHGPGFGVWGAMEKIGGDFLGWFSFQLADGASLHDARLGYRLRRAAWGQGFATEGARALIRTGFSDHRVQRVLATTYQDNAASRRVMEKVGMRLVRTFRLTPADLADTRTFVASGDLWDGDDVEYALEKGDWEQQHEG